MPATVVSAPPLSEYALDLAMAKVLEPRAPELMAFVITETGTERQLHEFANSTPGQSAAAARYFLRTVTGADRAVVVWDGYVTSLGKRTDAVLAEHSEAGAASSRIVGRRYRPAALFRPAVPLGCTVDVGEGHPLF
ncbi:MAG: hypothetical protein HY996_08850 [Micrococcales bacterium]|nr:hypothetical protein [Micrococcales bacterium]